MLQYILVNERVNERPPNFGVHQNFAVSEVPTEDELQTEILKLYRTAQNLRGPRSPNRPRSISIFVYPTEEHARETSHPIARLNWHQKYQREPSVSIDRQVLAFFSQPPAPETRFGLSEDEREKVYYDLGLITSRNLHEAQDAINALPEPVTKRQIKETYKRYDELRETDKIRLARKHGLTIDQLEEISSEGWRKYWISGVSPVWE